MQGGHFSGIYRKVQLKPQKWTKVAKGDDEVEGERPMEALMVLKYGGVLTHAGRKQVPINLIYLVTFCIRGVGLKLSHSSTVMSEDSWA